MQTHPRIHWESPVRAAKVAKVAKVAGAAEALEREGTDGPSAGREADRFRRIISLVPSLSETLVALGLADRLVGVTQYCVHPAGAFASLPKLGGTKDADVQAIVSLSPDLVIANQEENTPRVVRAIADQGIDVWVTYPRTVSDGVRLVEEMAGLGASAAAIAEVVEPVRAAFDRAESVARNRRRSGQAAPKVFCPIWRDPWMTIGRDTYVHDLLELCGAVNLFADGRGGGDPNDRRYPKLSLEDLVASAPDLILLPDEPYAFGPKDAAELARLDVPAAANGRIHLIDGTLVSWYGPRIAEAIQVLGGLFAIS